MRPVVEVVVARKTSRSRSIEEDVMHLVFVAGVLHVHCAARAVKFALWICTQKQDVYILGVIN